MTEAEFLALPPYRQDLLVATKVFGCELRMEETQDYGTYSTCGCGNGAHSEPSGWQDSIKSYSSDEHLIWEIVDELRCMGLSVDISSHPSDRRWLKPPYPGAPANKWTMEITAESFQCSVYRHDPDFDSWVVACDPVGMTRSIAVCIAALRIEGVIE